MDNVLSLIHSRLKPPDVISRYVRNTSLCRQSALCRSLGQAEEQRAECMLMTAEQNGAADSRLENKFTGRDQGEKFSLHLNYWKRYNKCTQEDRFPHTHVDTRLYRKLGMVTLTHGPFGPVGGIGHMIAPQRSSAVCHSNSVSSS